MNSNQSALTETLLCKVPQITLAFWVIKIMATTVGETAADFLIFNVGLGLVVTSLIMSALLVAVLAYQLKLREYVATSYWLVVVFVSVVGTLISDYMVDDLGISLVTTSIARSRSIRSLRASANSSTGQRSCSPSRSAHPPVT